ncbi:MAG: xylulokinase, partial [Lachnospirales bacterium]
MYKICIDIGTTTAKCVLFAEGINMIAESSHEYDLISSKGNWVQQDANDWWDATSKCIRDVVTQSKIDTKEIKVIGVSGQAPNFLPLDADGKTLCDSIIWMDRRTEVECAEFASNISPQRVNEITGNQIDALFLPPKFIWFKKNYPDLYDKTAHILSTNGFINYKLTGEYSYDKTNASMTLLYDIHNDCWSKEILDAVGISEAILPKLYNCPDVIGYTTKQVAQELGIEEGIPVIAGTVDTMSGSIEAGIVAKGDAFEAIGTSSCLTVAFDEKNTSPYLSTAIGLSPDIKIMVGPMSTTGASYKWCRDALRGGENDYGTEYINMENDIQKISPEPTNIIFLPYMAGERAPIWDSNARGVFFGLSLATTEAHLMRAVMEGTS